MSSNLTTQGSGSDDSLTAFVPTPEWIRQWGTIHLDESKDVAVDRDGNIYVTGVTDPYASSGNVNNYGLVRAWLIKYDSNGTKLWTQEIDSDKQDYSSDVATDSAGNVYITGSTHGDLDGSNAGFSDAWVGKYDSSGTRLWLKQLGSVGADSSSSVAVDGIGNVYISGSTSGNLGGANAGISDAWLAKYDSVGNLQWLQQFGSGNGEASDDVAVDSVGNIYITGNIRVDSGYDTWIAKYDSSGTRQWWKQLDSASYIFSSIAVDSTGNVYISGKTDGIDASGEDVWIAKYDTDGDRQWWEQLRTTETERAYKIAVDKDDNPYITGYLSNEISTGVWAINPFVAKYDGLGNRRWIQQLGSTDARSTPWGIDLDSDGNIYLGGHTEDDFGASNAGHLDAWLAKLAPYTTNSLPAIVNNKGLTLDEGGSATISSDLLEITDVDSAPVTYTLAALPANGILKLNDTEMEVSDTFTQADLDASNLVYIHDGSEVTSDSFGLTVPGKNGSQIRTTDFPITVNPVNNAPTNISINGSSVDSNSANGALIGSLTTMDAEDDDTHTYTLVDDAEGRFAIDGDRLIIADESKIDYNNAKIHTVKLRTTDNGTPSLSFEQDLNISVIGETEEPLKEWIQQLDVDYQSWVLASDNNIYAATRNSIAKYDSAGTKLWERSVVANSEQFPEIATDNNGNVYFAGNTSTSVVNEYGYPEIEKTPIVIKYDSSGNQQWQQELEFERSAYSGSVVTDNEDNLYIIGTVEGNYDEHLFFVAKYNKSGDREWIKEGKMSGGYGLVEDIYYQSTVDDDGSIYFTGTIKNEGYHAFVTKYDSSGNQQWMQSLDLKPEPLMSPTAGDLAVDSNKNVYVSGNTRFYNHVWFTMPHPDPKGTLVKYDSNGNQQWQKQLEETIGSVEVDREDNVYVRVTEGINKYDKEGNLVWEKQLQSPLSPYFDFKLDDDDKAYFKGSSWLAKLDINAGANEIASNGLTLDEGATTTITNNELKLDDAEIEQVAYTITALPTSGSLKLNNVELALDRGFTQADIDGGRLTYTHDGSDTTSDIFSFITIYGLGVGIEGDFQIAVNPVNDAPTEITLSSNTIAENSETGTVIGDLTTTDSDSDTHTYTLVENPEGRFAIVGNQLKVADGSKLDFEANSSYTIKVRATDNGEPVQSLDKDFVIDITDVNEAPTDITLNKNSIAENSDAGKVIGKLTTTDSDSDTHTYTLVENPDGGFAIEGNQLKVADSSKLDFEANTSHTIKVRTTDNGEPAQSLDKDFVIDITDVNEAPTDITLNKNSIAENSDAGKVIGKLTTTDSDSDTHTYTLVKNPGGRFVIEGNKLKVADGSKLDFEANTSHTIKIRTADNGSPKKSFSKEFSIAVTDIEDNSVKSTTNYRLGATKENLNLIGKDAINGTGNNLDNRISGNNAKNRIWGKEGNDVLIGRGDNDVLKGEGGKDNLNGGKGNDNLNGGKGRDTMTGGAGNDTFVVDNVKDVVTESAKGGKDLVKSSVSYSLPERVENLTLTGKSAINGTGNKLSNRIVGNDGKNRLNGKGGSDVLIGNDGSDTLMGGGGNDLLNGGAGNDTLTGGGGSDRFLFASPGKDLIRDFKNRDSDKIILDKTTFGALDSKAGSGFSVVAEFDVVKRDAAVASSDAIIVYNENNGKLFYNANGSKSGLGAGGIFAVLDNSPQLQVNDFIIRA